MARVRFRAPNRFQPRLQFLEGRLAPATVFSLSDGDSLDTLRGAIAMTPPDGVVDFAPGLSGTITLTNGVLSINKNLTIIGPGASTITVDGGQQAPVFSIEPGAAAQISGLTITNGVIGLRNNGTLSLSDCVVTNNSNPGSGGGGEPGGLENSSKVTINNCTFANNNGYSVGAVSNTGDATIVNSKFISNGSTADGAAIDNQGVLVMATSTIENNSGQGISNRGTLTVYGSTIASNTTNVIGGGIANLGTVTLINSTIANNVATGQSDVSGGGGIYNTGQGTLTVLNSTIVGNQANGTGGGIGVFAFGGTSAITILNSIIAKNTASNGSPDMNAFGFGNATVVVAHSLIGIGDGSGVSNGANGNKVGTASAPIDPLLGPLAVNGGQIATMALLGGSPAFDAGDATVLGGGIPTDQRGTPRVSNGQVDMGAFEHQFAAPIIAAGSSGRVQVRRAADNASYIDFAPFPGYNGPVAVAVADFDKDGYFDVLAAAIAGNPHVRIFRGSHVANANIDPFFPTASVLTEWFAYGLNFNVGANVAIGDINADGFPDVVTGATIGNPDVRVLNGKDIAAGSFQPEGQSLLATWFPYALNFNVGVSVGVGDVTKDGYADIITAANVGNPHVNVYSGADIANNAFNPHGASLRASVFPFAVNFNVGAFVAAGDIDGDGFADIITGSTTGNPNVRVYRGSDVAQGTFDANNSLIADFFAFELGTNTGVTVGAADHDNDGKFDVLTGRMNGTATYRLVSGASVGVLPPAIFEGALGGAAPLYVAG